MNQSEDRQDELIRQMRHWDDLAMDDDPEVARAEAGLLDCSQADRLKELAELQAPPDWRPFALRQLYTYLTTLVFIGLLVVALLQLP